ncbi:MAG TPA: FeoA family protein [Rhizomicrobium sp.]|nr:FeoA family protein [Rhizomicrobium sp.]
MRLSDLAKGDSGIIRGIEPAGHDGLHEIGHEELERRLLEMGFVEGARFQILHEGLIGRDPIALKLDDMRVALRRNEARTILVDPLTDTVEPARVEDMT